MYNKAKKEITSFTIRNIPKNKIVSAFMSASKSVKKGLGLGV